MCGATVTTFTDCQHSKVTYIYCDSCPLDDSPPKQEVSTRKSVSSPTPISGFILKRKYKHLHEDRHKYQSFWKDFWEHLYKQTIESRVKMMDCPNWPAEFKQRGYGTISVRGQGECLEEGGACANRGPRQIDGFDKDGLFLRQRYSVAQVDYLWVLNLRVGEWLVFYWFLYRCFWTHGCNTSNKNTCVSESWLLTFKKPKW